MKSIILFLSFAFMGMGFAGAQTTKYVKRIVTIKNDGWELKGDLTLLNSKKNMPVVLMLNKANGNRDVYKQTARLLAERGISSLAIDLRGHGQSINKGRFIPFDSLNNVNIKLTETYRDIVAGYKYLISIKHIDRARVGIIGASYSGEDMMAASRSFKYAKAYLALSPGSFSDLSLSSIDSLNIKILFIKSMEEKSMLDFEKDVFAKSKTAKVLIVGGKAHATDILSSYPEITVIVADWFKDNL